MRIALKRRLERLEGRIGPTAQRVLVIQQPGESRADMDARLERWKSGEVVKGIQSGKFDDVYRGDPIFVMYILFVEPHNETI